MIKTKNKSLDDQILFYVIKNHKGQFYKTYKTYNPAGWVDDLVSARIYAKESMARAKVTAYANENPREQIPDIVELTVTKTRVIDQKARIKQAKAKKDQEKVEQIARAKKAALDEAQKQFDNAKKRLLELSGKTEASRHA